MTADTAGGRRRVLRFALAAVVVVLLLIVLLDPVPLVSDIFSVARIRLELPRAVARWRSSGISSYRMHVTGAVPLACIIDGELTVEAGRLVEVLMREEPFAPDSPLQAVEPAEWRSSGCSYEDLTVESMFERLETSLAGLAMFGAPLTVRFDEERGFITEYRFGRASRGGVFGYTLSECCTWFDFDLLAASDP
jgi:hypothetical protein